ncbi:MAG: hypothetical protein R3345_15430, partial [Fulvivirga sp.]|nr:hypothetical protein [Fulvivirga sp.]
MGKISISAVILVACMSLIGLSWVQYSWLNESINTNRQIFYQKVDLASNYLGVMMQQNSQLLENMQEEIRLHGNISQKTQGQLVNVVDSILEIHHIQTDFEYGIYKHAASPNTFTLVSGTAKGPPALEIACQPEERAFGW